MLQGSLDRSTLISLIHDLHVDKKSGLLLVSAEEVSKRIHFREGAIVFANSDLNADRLGEFLIRMGKIKRPDFDLAYQLMNDLQLRLGGTLVQMGHLSREELQHGVTEQIRAIIRCLFAWSSGAYAFDDRAPSVDEDILLDMSTADIILEGARRLADRELIRRCLETLRRCCAIPRTRFRFRNGSSSPHRRPLSFHGWTGPPRSPKWFRSRL